MDLISVYQLLGDMMVMMHSKLTKKCYSFKTSAPPILQLPPEQWLSQLGDLMAEACGYDRNETRNLKVFLQAVAGVGSKYDSRENLAHLLQIIYNGFSSNVNPFDIALKKSIVEQTYEAEKNTCIVGFHDRVAEVVTGLSFDESIGGFLMQERKRLVDNTARMTTNDVHFHNRFLQVAHSQGYGIPEPFNDRFFGPKEDHLIQTLLQTAFDANYEPIRLLDNVTQALKTHLQTIYGYVGENQNGYENGDYDKFNDFLNRVFEKRGRNLTNYILLDEDTSNAIDLDWNAIKIDLLTTLCNEHYFKLTSEESHLILQLLHTKKNPVECLFIGPRCLVQNNETYFHLLSFLNPTHAPMILNLTHAFIKVQKECSEENIAKICIPVLHLFRKNRDVATNIITCYSKEILSHYGPQVLISLIYDCPAGVLAVMKKILTLTINDQSAILQATKPNGYNALMISLRANLDRMIPALLNCIKEFDPITKSAILLKTDSDDYNALLITTRYNPHALPIILDTINTLADADRIAAFRKKTRSGNNVLMLACLFQPTLIPLLLTAIDSLPIDIQTALLSERSKKGYNILMTAAEHCPEMIPALKVAIDPLSDQTKSAILSAKNAEGSTALKLVANNSLPHVKYILELRPSKKYYREIEDTTGMFNHLRGTPLKTAILEKYSNEIAWCDSADALNTIKRDLPNRPDYRLLATPQSRFSFFKTNSVRILNTLIASKEAMLQANTMGS